MSQTPQTPALAAQPERRAELRSHFARDADGLHYVELFLVSAISAVLVIRGFLYLTGYPQLAPRGLHIAHMLWGGFFMLAALLILLTTLERRARPLVAVIGGLGFGTFIDELGKFVTRDNNYFFEPTIAIIYLTFIILFITLRAWLTSRGLTETEHVVNAAHALQDMMLWDLDANEKHRAEDHLRQCDPRDVRVALLSDLLAQAATVPVPPGGLYSRVRSRLAAAYRRLIEQRRFAAGLTLVFVLKSLAALAHTLVLKFGPHAVSAPVVPGTPEAAGVPPHWVELIAMIASTLLVLRGVSRLRRSRLDAYRDFRRSLVVTITIGYAFAFYDDQLGALAGLLGNLVLFSGIQILIGLEHRLLEARGAVPAGTPPATPAPATAPSA
ncbi:MAG TPA: hypothetical protein VNM87_00060 [Candidatus Udaeobacter sp.]|nr:hypothetical protein [Candidatus Udaeobacter sp.]